MTTALRPMTTGELLDRTFFLYRRHFALFVGISALAYVPFFASQLIGVALQGSGTLATIASVAWSLVIAAAFMASYSAAHGATVLAVSAVHLDQPTSVGAAYAPIKPRIPRLALIMLAGWIGIAVGLLLLVVPGIIFALMWALVIPVAVVENRGFSDSFARSRALTKGDRGRIFVIYFLFAVLTWIVVMVINTPLFAVIGFSRTTDPAAIPVWVNVLGAVTGFLSNALVSPLLTIALSLVYYDERVRKEGYDIQLMVASLEGPQASAAHAGS